MLCRTYSVLIITCALLATSVQARNFGPLSVEDRSFGANQRGSTSNQGEDGLYLLLEQNAELQEQIRHLEGQIEELRHQFERMRQGERQRYLDLDSRINAIVDGKVGAEPGESSSVEGSSSERDPQAQADADAEAYHQARELLSNRDFDGAVAAFEQYLADFPDGDNRPFAHFWLGRIYSSKPDADTDAAIGHLQTVVNDFPDHAQAPASLYSLAVIQSRAGDAQSARDNLRKLLDRYPDSSEREHARTFLEQL